MLAARDVFSERGYDAATFQEIALRADLTRPAINHYFSSKRVLYREVMDQTTEVMVKASVQRAQRETTLVGRVSVFLTAAIEADSENRSAARFLLTSMLESQRHPDLHEGENQSVRYTRAFLVWATADAIDRGELTTDIDVESLTELLLALLCGVGFYAGFVESAHEMSAIVDHVERLLAGTLWQLRQ